VQHAKARAAEVAFRMGSVSSYRRSAELSLEAARVASLFYLVPPVVAVEGFLLFGETLLPLQVAGIAITALGVALINRR
jgi:drug/metabolite transporter (DMT)-like permease